jgi:hypothetical protein
LAGQVLLKIAWLLMRWLFGLAGLMFRGNGAKDAELLLARDYRQQPGRPAVEHSYRQSGRHAIRQPRTRLGCDIEPGSACPQITMAEEGSSMASSA